MTISVIGVAGSMDTTGFSKLMRRSDQANGRDSYVPTGLAVSAAAGTRTVSVSAGESYQAGTLLTSDATATVTLAANTSTNPRIDVIVAEVDWVLSSGVAADFSNAGTLKAVAGTPAASPAPPALTQTPGSLWRTPLAYVRVAAGAATISTANITDARPGAATQTFTSLSIPAASASTWTQPGAAPLGVQRSGAWVELSGRLTFTASNQPIGTNLQFSNVPIIPDGYRPLRDEVATCYGNPGSGNVNEMIFHTDGTVDFWVVVGTLTTGNVLRVTTTSWIGA